MNRRWILALVLLVGLIPSRAWAEPQDLAPSAVTVESIVHTSNGVTILLETTDPDLFSDGIAASIDGRVAPASIQRLSETRPGPLVILLETSSSMDSEMFAAARDVARGIVQAAPPDTPVTLVTFANELQVIHGDGPDQDNVSRFLDELTPHGGSALFDAIASIADISEVNAEPATVVILTFGWDFGGVSAIDWEEAVARGSSISGRYAAVIFGSSFDRRFFEALVDQTGGELVVEPAQFTLPPLTQYKFSWEVQLDAPPMSAGVHTVSLSGATSGSATILTESFEVQAAQGIRLDIQAASAPSGLIDIQLGSAEASDYTDLSITAGGESMDWDPSAGGAALNPWHFDPGPLLVRVVANVGGQLAEESLVVMIPRLAPSLAVSVKEPDRLAVVELVGQVQSSGGRIRVISGTREFVMAARRGTTTVLLPAGEWGGARVRLESRDGTALKTGTIPQAARNSSNSVLGWVVLISFVIAGTATVSVWVSPRQPAGQLARSLRRGASGALVVTVLAISVSLVALQTNPGPISVIVTIIFVLIGPGLAAVRWLPGADGRDWIVVPATGLSAAALLSLAALYSGWWAPDILLVILAAVSVAVALVATYRMAVRQVDHIES